MSENPMEQAATQAAQSAAMSVRLLVTISMAVAERMGRENPARAAQVERLRQLARTGQDPATRYAQMVRDEFATPTIREALLNSEQWPQIAQDLAYLESAGINVRSFLRDAATIADRIAGTVAPPPTPEQMVRDHLGGQLAETLLTSERWPQIADEIRQMQAAGVDVPQMLRAAAEPGAKVEATLGAAWREQAARAERLEKEAAPREAAVRGASRPEQGRRFGRRGKGLDSRKADLKEVGLSPQENERYVRMVGEAVENRHHAELLVVSGAWPWIAASMHELHGRNMDPAARLARLPQEIARQVANGRPVSLVEAAEEALRQPAPASKVAAPSAPAPPPAYSAKAAAAPANADSASVGHTVEVSEALVREAAHHVIGAREGVNAQTLRDGLGVTKGQAEALVKELAQRDVIGRYEVKVDRYQVQAKSELAADLLMEGKETTATRANRTADAYVARATSTNGAVPQAKSEPVAAAPVRTAPAQSQTKGRTR